jgi:hypothetical protein
MTMKSNICSSVSLAAQIRASNHGSGITSSLDSSQQVNHRTFRGELF